MTRNEFPERSSDLVGPCTRKILQTMLRNRRYELQETALKKDHGIVKLYMLDCWANPMLFLIGEYLRGYEPDWGAVYDRAMARHLETKRNRSRYRL